MHAAKAFQNAGVIRDRSNGPMRDFPGIKELRAGDVNKAPAVVVGFACGGVAWIDDRYAVDIEVVAIGARINGANRNFPNTIGAFLQGGTGTLAGDIARAETDGLGVRSTQAKGNVPV